MKVLVTGAAGFIGAKCCEELLARGDEVYGIDNLNDYYDVNLKLARLETLKNQTNFHFSQIDIKDAKPLTEIFASFKPDRVLHLAAQAGVRYSIDNPMVYVDSNLVGFANMLECVRQHKPKHFVFASSSSVYGANKKLPYEVTDNVDYPVSFYAASKKANELMAHSYSHLYEIPMTGLRYFTVYGPWGRPDMAPIKFAKKILNHEPIQIYNHGHHSRDFTFIDDIVKGSLLVLDKAPQSQASPSGAAYKVYNIGRGAPVELLRFIELLEQNLGVAAKKEFLPKQPGDVDHTFADTKALANDFGYAPKVDLEEGIAKFAKWYLNYNH